MMKLLALTLALPLLLQTYIIPGRPHIAAAGGGIEDDFSGDLSKWTQLVSQSGDWTINGSDELTTGSTWGVIIYTDEQTDTISQWFQYRHVEGLYGGTRFRSVNDDEEYSYTLRPNATGDLDWCYCLGEDCWVIEITTGKYSEGDCIGAEVTGTGDATRLDIWNHGTGACPERGSWGSEDDTLLSDPSNAADVGKYVGFYSGYDGDEQIFDNFSAGDV